MTTRPNRRTSPAMSDEDLADAKREWQTQVNRAWELGQHELIADHVPTPGAGVRQLDRCADGLRKALDTLQGRVTP